MKKAPLPIYFDYAATTPMDPAVQQAMLRYLTQDGLFGNPSSSHVYGEQAQEAINEAQIAVAQLINADPGSLLWTSGATEAINLALKGVADFYQHKGSHIITVCTEHQATLESCQALADKGFNISYLPVLKSGLLDLNILEQAITEQTILVSVMQVNNETGIIQDIAAIAKLCKARKVLLHVDAAQSVGKIAVDVQALDVDLLSFSAHKIYGPKGCGALYLRQKPKVRLTPLVHGGAQQAGLRSGTLATAQIIGMGMASKIAQRLLTEEKQRLYELRQQLWEGIKSLPGIQLNGDLSQQIPGILNVSFADIEGEALLMSLAGLALSSGSACNATNIEPSHVLTAMGCSAPLAHSALRFSIGRFTSFEHIQAAIEHLTKAVYRCLSLSPFYEGTLPNLSLRLNTEVVLTKHYSVAVWENFLQIEEEQNLDSPEYPVFTIEEGTRLQGNVVQLSIQLKDKRIVNARFKAYGCGVMLATAAFATKELKGKTLEHAQLINSNYLISQLQLAPSKFHCALRMEDCIKALLTSIYSNKGALNHE